MISLKVAVLVKFPKFTFQVGVEQSLLSLQNEARQSKEEEGYAPSVKLCSCSDKIEPICLNSSAIINHLVWGFFLSFFQANAKHFTLHAAKYKLCHF